jgi:DNA-binding transcriptional regulator YhcF (GntR family)
VNALDTDALPSQDVPVRRLDPNSNRPPYLQIADAIRDAIRSGEFRPGEQIPSRAELADRLDAAPMTITAAIRVLKDDGLLVSRLGVGVFVHTAPPAPGQSVTFGHVLTVDPHSVELHECGNCGALVMPAARQKHADWHRNHGE